MALIATPGTADANSYPDLAYATAYFTNRVAMPGWENADDQEALLIMGTRSLDMILSPYREFFPPKNGQAGYYKTRVTWTGAPTVPAVQALAWPRTGMFNRNGYPIGEMIIPDDLKNAVCEYAGVLGGKDLLLDNDVAVQGITSVRAGSVSVTFADGAAMTSKMLPDAVLISLVPSWLTEEVIEGMYQMAFDVL